MGWSMKTAIDRAANSYKQGYPMVNNNPAAPTWENTQAQTPIYGGAYWAGLEARAVLAKRLAEVSQPYIDSGQAALTGLQSLQAGDVPMSAIPGAQWRIAQAQKALQRHQGAKGYFRSGRAALELNRGIQSMASQEYANEFLRRYKMAYAGSPFSSATIGAKDYPTLHSFQNSYKDMFTPARAATYPQGPAPAAPAAAADPAADPAPEPSPYLPLGPTTAEAGVGLTGSAWLDWNNRRKNAMFG